VRHRQLADAACSRVFEVGFEHEAMGRDRGLVHGIDATIERIDACDNDLPSPAGRNHRLDTHGAVGEQRTSRPARFFDREAREAGQCRVADLGRQRVDQPTGRKASMRRATDG
jgi:hypothetical protein